MDRNAYDNNVALCNSICITGFTVLYYTGELSSRRVPHIRISLAHEISKLVLLVCLSVWVFEILCAGYDGGTINNGS